MSASPDGHQLDRLELAALAYLLLPLPIFLWGWWRWPVALAGSGLLALMAWRVWVCRRRGAVHLSAALGLALAGVALLWVAAGGLLGGLPLNEDWRVRMPVLRDLTLGAWPVSYGPLGGGEALLRTSFGFYLLPAALGALLGGVEAARLLLGAWTALGVLLLFALVVQAWPVRRGAAVAGLLALLMLFSGMDLPGFLVGRAYTPAWGEHIEWWTPWMQYSSQTTLLFWAPNHALPAWLGVALAWRHRATGLALAPAALLVVAAAFWSPLACLGLLPLLALPAWAALRAELQGRTAWPWRALLQPAVLAALPLLALFAVFVTFGAGHAAEGPGRVLSELAAPTVLWHQWLTFQVLEWGALAGVLIAAGPRRLGAGFWVACALLLVLPSVRFGPGNDLMMRGGIAAVTWLLLCTAEALSREDLPARLRGALLVILLIGAATPLQELLRQTQDGPRFPDDGRHLVQVEGLPWHYIGRLRPTDRLAGLLQPPQRLRVVSGSPGVPAAGALDGQRQ